MDTWNLNVNRPDRISRGSHAEQMRGASQFRAPDGPRRTRTRTRPVMIRPTKHRPTIDPGSAGKFDLQLSGHTHHGQIFPFQLLTRLVYPLLGGDHVVPGGGTLHVSRGTGTWGPPMRLLARPEITIIDLEGSR